jgi:hypothetical protein
MASGNFAARRFLVNAPLAVLLEFEMFDRVGEVNIRAVDLRVFKGAVQQTSCRANERSSGQVLFVPGLLPYHHYSGTQRTFA